ncbi:AI-2E family transporter [Sinorhizobium medicae]|uniref:AI-2E family transporter n=1 Tax=Sinorhizobium medicae TaxID=110321 RepID=A0A508X5V1_9HYPH|nr:AI-2E family transporter [Sinorhizobium medicae]MBO1941810.1 AI-2E family transporter [Sinorhizobium medicae]MBO1960832.1 AI-2E family transporter [Sinorhizobium medicae]MDX0456602.1 AI-2E family transporter [Sinorhizobium medicae]MDX0514115.1 AI-2E family transporter [Sinorhizobium medicae]MDX0520749.1 AI-2E family transporter [Sinorhizobium medicae]
MAKSISVRDEDENSNRLFTPRRSRTLAVLVALLVGLVVCTFLTVPFLPALTWALVLAVMFQPLHRRVKSRFRYPDAAAAATVAIAVFVVAVPLTFMAERLVNEAAKGAKIIEEALRSGTWRDALANYPRLAPAVVWIETQLDLAGIAGSATSWLTNFSASFVRGSVAQIIDAVLTFYFLFYFMRDGRQVLAALKEHSPLSEQDMNRLFTRVHETVHAVVFGTVAVAAVQGAMGGLMFWLLGLPAPVVWGLAMGLLAVVPVLGAFIVWLPAALSLALSGEWGKALILAGWGAGVVATIDNLLYPIFVGDRLKLHTLTAFMSMIGGIIVFGSAGLVIGPVAFTVTLLLLDIWRQHNTEPRA